MQGADVRKGKVVERFRFAVGGDADAGGFFGPSKAAKRVKSSSQRYEVVKRRGV